MWESMKQCWKEVPIVELVGALIILVYLLGL